VRFVTGSLGVLAATLVVAPVALATNLTGVLYKPPKIMLVDQFVSGSIENVTVTKAGSEFSFAQSFGIVQDPASEPGCTDDFSTDYRCPVAGIKRIVLKLGTLDDAASIDLGSKATKVEQILKGGEGGDTLTGGPGPQLIDGGPGIDTCVGGPGRDTIRHCE